MGKTSKSTQVTDGHSGPVGVATRPTLATIARVAGVNKSTASRALRGDAAIAAETRERIQQLAAQLNYEPHAAARRLTSARTDIIAFTTHSFARGRGAADPFLAELVSAVTIEAAASHMDVLLCLADPGPNELNAYRRVVGGKHADGFLLMDLRPNDLRLPFLCERGYPHVLFGRPYLDLERSREYPYPWVEIDNRKGARAAAEHLIALGHSRIALIGCGDEYICEIDRLAGYQDALASANIPFDPSICTGHGQAQEDGFQLARALLEQPNPPTAILAVSDIVAVGAMLAVRDLGRKPGQDVPVVGFDGLGLATFVTPALTTVSQPIPQVGKLLVRLLLAELHAEPVAERHILLDPELIIRASTEQGARPFAS
ncbi:MAG TPA: LacI family DNA-binding transcriptional regulator [Ktedonobacterales bacterium]